MKHKQLAGSGSISQEYNHVYITHSYHAVCNFITLVFYTMIYVLTKKTLKSTASSVLFCTQMARAPAPNSTEKKKIKPDRDSEMKQWYLSLQGINKQKINISLVRAHLTFFLSWWLGIQKGTWDKLHSVLLTLQARDMLKKLFHQPYPPVAVASCLPCCFRPFNPLQLSPHISGKETNKKARKRKSSHCRNGSVASWIFLSNPTRTFPSLKKLSGHLLRR